MKQFETSHLTPLEMKQEGHEPVHLLKTFNPNGEVVGFAEMKYFGGKPSFYFVQNLGNVTEGKDGDKEEGVGSELIKKINDLLIEKKSIGYLANTSDIPDLYTKRGWKASTLADNFCYYGELTEEEERSIIERLGKHLIKVSTNTKNLDSQKQEN